MSAFDKGVWTVIAAREYGWFDITVIQCALKEHHRNNSEGSLVLKPCGLSVQIGVENGRKVVLASTELCDHCARDVRERY